MKLAPADDTAGSLHGCTARAGITVRLGGRSSEETARISALPADSLHSVQASGGPPVGTSATVDMQLGRWVDAALGGGVLNTVSRLCSADNAEPVPCRSVEGRRCVVLCVFCETVLLNAEPWTSLRVALRLLNVVLADAGLTDRRRMDSCLLIVAIETLLSSGPSESDTSASCTPQNLTQQSKRTGMNTPWCISLHFVQSSPRCMVIMTQRAAA